MDEDENVDLVSNEEDDLEESIIYRTYRMDFQNKRIIGLRHCRREDMPMKYTMINMAVTL